MRLADTDTEPTSRRVTAAENADEVVRIGFQPSQPPLDRFSPLYCAYNGFLLGQFLSLAFAQFGGREYVARRSRMLEFLSEIDVALDIPGAPPGLGSETHVDLLQAVLPRVLERWGRSRTSCSSVPLCSRTTGSSPTPIRRPPARPSSSSNTCARSTSCRRSIRRAFSSIRSAATWTTCSRRRSLISGRSSTPSRSSRETAFVIMPFKQPYASYYGTLYRPALESTGYRAFRAWGGLGSEDYCALLLKLIAKCGLVWADASELNYNVLYELGAAHALGKLSMIVVREEVRRAHAGEYRPRRHRPLRPARRRLAAGDGAADGDADQHAQVRGRARGAPARDAGLRAGGARGHGAPARRTAYAPEARAVRHAGQLQLEAGDYAAAERSFEEAMRLGLDDVATLLGRGWSRVALARYAEAEADFGAALADADESDAASRPNLGVAAYSRGIAREQQDRLEAARADYTRAIGLGFAGANVYRSRARVTLALGLKAEARQDADRARQLAPDDEEMKELEAALAEAGA